MRKKDNSNAARHGLYAKKAIVMPSESVEDYEALQDGIKKELAPAGAFQSAIVRQLADNIWLAERARKAVNSIVSTSAAELPQEMARIEKLKNKAAKRQRKYLKLFDEVMDRIIAFLSTCKKSGDLDVRAVKKLTKELREVCFQFHKMEEHVGRLENSVSVMLEEAAVLQEKVARLAAPNDKLLQRFFQLKEAQRLYPKALTIEQPSKA
jgi:hypothetical protein